MAIGPVKSQGSLRGQGEMFAHLLGLHCEPQPQAGCSPAIRQSMRVNTKVQEIPVT